MKPWLLGLCALVVAGCGASSAKQTTVTDKAPENQKSQEEMLYEQLHSAAYQLDVAADSVQAAYEAAVDLRDRAPKRTDLKEALTDLAEYLDSAGSEISEIPEGPESIEQLNSDFDGFRARLKKTLTAASNAKRDLQEAQGLTESLLEVAAGEAHEPIQDLADMVNHALEGVIGAVETLSGKPEPKPAL